MLPTALRRQTRAANLKKSGPFGNSIYLVLASPVAWMIKNLPANAGDTRATGSILGLGRSPGGGHGNLLQYSCLENPMDRGASQDTVHGVATSRTRLSARAHIHVCKYTHSLYLVCPMLLDGCHRTRKSSLAILNQKSISYLLFCPCENTVWMRPLKNSSQNISQYPA